MNESETLEKICRRLREKIKATFEFPQYNQGLLDAWEIILDVREEAIESKIKEMKDGN